MSAIQIAIGDQKIDIVTIPFLSGHSDKAGKPEADTDISLIVENAIREGIQL